MDWIKSMKAVLVRPFLFTILLGGITVTSAQPPNPTYQIHFYIKNMGITVEGALNQVAGEIQFNPSKPQLAKINVQLPLTGLNTGNRLRDHHLRSSDYFNAASWPTIDFQSDSVVKEKEDHWVLYGHLQIKATKKHVKIPFHLQFLSQGMLKANAEILLNRREFGVGSKSLILSDRVKVVIEVVW